MSNEDLFIFVFGEHTYLTKKNQTQTSEDFYFGGRTPTYSARGAEIVSVLSGKLLSETVPEASNSLHKLKMC